MQGDKLQKHNDISGTIVHSGSAYKLLEPLGEGGMGSVYKALRITEGGHRQFVALKVVRDMNDEASCVALAREAKRISEIRHDNIVSFVDSGPTDDNQLFVALEYIPGIDLNQFLSLHGLNRKNMLKWRKPYRIPDQITGFIMLMAARALDAAHTHEFEDGKIGLVNRDVSPDNFVIERKYGFVKQIDFGVAETIDDVRRIQAEAEEEGRWNLTGKLLYMTPEEISTQELDARTDICALGLVGRKLVTGFDQYDCLDPDANFMRCLYHIMSVQETPLVPLQKIVEGVDRRLDEILLKMTHPKKEERYQSAAELMNALEDYLYKGGKGPTVTSLHSYIRLMKSNSSMLRERERKSLEFLEDRARGTLRIREPYILTNEARMLLKRDINPAVFRRS